MEILKMVYEHIWSTLAIIFVTGWAISEIIESFRKKK
jgi:hypothetical protein